MRNILKWFLISLLVIHGALKVFWSPNQPLITSFIYFPGKENFYSCDVFGREVERVAFQGTRMYYKNNGTPLAVYYHGSDATACDRKYYADVFDAAHLSYILVEYCGYAGDTESFPSRPHILQDVRNVMKFAELHGHSVKAVIGGSIGSGPASIHIAWSNPQPERALFVASFSRLSDVGHLTLFIYPLRLLLWISGEEYDNVHALRNFKGSLLVIHGTKDSLVPWWSGRQLYLAAPHASSRSFLSVKGAMHDIRLLKAEGVEERIIQFLSGDPESQKLAEGRY